MFVHEIGHALGLAHELQRSEAWDHHGQSIAGVPYGPYDPVSTMHYGSSLQGMSLGDIASIRHLYALSLIHPGYDTASLALTIVPTAWSRLSPKVQLISGIAADYAYQSSAKTAFLSRSSASSSVLGFDLSLGKRYFIRAEIRKVAHDNDPTSIYFRV